MKVELLTELPIEQLLTEFTGDGGRATDPAIDPPARLPELDMALFLKSSRPLRGTRPGIEWAMTPLAYPPPRSSSDTTLAPP